MGGHRGKDVDEAGSKCMHLFEKMVAAAEWARLFREDGDHELAIDGRVCLARPVVLLDLPAERPFVGIAMGIQK